MTVGLMDVRKFCQNDEGDIIFLVCSRQRSDSVFCEWVSQHLTLTRSSGQRKARLQDGTSEGKGEGDKKEAGHGAEGQESGG